MIPLQPIQTQKEADEVFGYLASETAKNFKIPIEEAVKRVDGLFKSGILNGGSPNDQDTQMKIHAFLSIPSKEYAHLK